MAVSTNEYLKGFFDSTKAMGEKVIGSDFAFQLVDYPDTWLLCKQAPWPESSPQGEIEVATPMGGVMWQPQQIQVAQQGQVSFYETVAGQVEQTLVSLLVNQHGRFDAWVYEGTPERYIRRKLLRDCFMQIDNPDRDWENRSQPLMFSGTLFFHYFGETEQGNSSDYR